MKQLSNMWYNSINYSCYVVHVSPRIYLISLYPLTTFTTSPHPLSLILGQSPIRSVFMISLDKTEIIFYLSFSDILHLAYCPQGPSVLFEMAGFLSFLWLNSICACECICISPFLFTFIHRWTLRLFPCLAYCKKCCNKYRSVDISLR